MLEACGVTIRGGKAVLVDDVSLSLRAGELKILIGPNGAGKTSLLRALAGVARPEGGSVHLNGTSLAAMPGRDRARSLAYLPQERSVAWPMKVRDVVASRPVCLWRNARQIIGRGRTDRF